VGLQVSAVPVISHAGFVVGGILLFREPLSSERRWAVKIRQEEVVRQISSDFINCPTEHIDEGVQSALEKLGRIYHADRTYVFVLDPGGQSASNTHEWCAEGVVPQKEYLQNMYLFSEYNWMAERLLRLESIHVPSVSHLPPEAEAVRELLLSQDIQSMMVTPLSVEGTFAGFLGMDSVKAMAHWPEKALEVLKSAGEIISFALRRKTAETDLSEINQRYRDIVDMTSDLIFHLYRNAEGLLEVDWVPGRWTQNHGYEPGPLVSENTFKRLIHPDDLELALRRIQLAMQGEEVKLAFRMYTSSREERWMEGSVRPSFGLGRANHAVVGALSDVTERKLAEQALTDLTEALMVSHEELHQFAEITSHNLRNSVANLLGLKDLYDKQGSSDNSQVIEKIFTSIRQLDLKLNDLAEVVEVKNRRSRLLARKISPEAIFRQAMKEFDADIRDTDAVFYTDFSEIAEVSFPESYFHAIMVSLISNSLKFRAPQRRPEIRVGSFKEKNAHVLTFADNGIGMDLVRHKGRIFTMYQQLHEGYEGKGLDLYLTRCRMEAMGGKIEVKSTPGKETIFYLYFVGQDY
jgi:PAS domain S-box-containing protein